MSYIRMGELGSQVYVYATVDGGYECCFCAFRDAAPPGEMVTRCKSPEEMIEHLRSHRQAGHRVPARVFEELAQEVAG